MDELISTRMKPEWGFDAPSSGPVKSELGIHQQKGY